MLLRGAFTLLELLVSMTVLGVIVVLVALLTNGASLSIGNSGRHMDAGTQARLLFNRMAVEFGKMVKRPDVDYSVFKQPAGSLSSQYGNATIAANTQAGNDQIAFYSETDGYFSGATQPRGTQRASVSMVAYMVSSDPCDTRTPPPPVLRRMGKGLGWEPDSSGAWGSVVYLPMTLPGQWPKLFDNTEPDYKTVGDQVFRFEYTYLLKSTATQAARLSITPYDTSATPPHSSIDGFKDVAAIVVTIGVLDSTSRVIVGDYNALTAAFPDATDGTDTAAAWNSVVNSGSFAATAGIPKTAAAAVRVYQRYFYLDTPQ